MGENRLIVVSNRLPLTLRRAGAGWRAERSTGGLATALEPVMRRRHGIWLGWPGDPPDAPDPERSRTLAQWEEEHGLIAVDLPKAVAHHFYHGFSNGTLWPLFHEFPSRFEYSDRGWEAYVEANERFADAVVRRARPGDTVWVHDYHLMLVPQLLRKRSPDLAIGFFLHIPFPPSDVFRVLPNRGELLRGLLGADCIAFQTHRFVQHFRASLLRILGISSRMDGVEVGGRTAGLEAQPIGIHPEEFAGAVETDRGVARSMAELKRRFEGRRILLAVDRLDYTKGIPQRLRAYRRLLETVPETRRTVVLVQIAVPSRERIPLYSELREEVNRLVGEINGALSTPDWAPIVYIRRAVPRPELVALYASADVAWVAPLRDGMNLVAKEYVACKRGGDGALVLSEFAGAAAEMGEALLVNPYDEHLTVDAVARALAMPHEERRERMTALYRRVLRNNAVAWSERFLTALDTATAIRVGQGPARAEPLPLSDAVAAFRAADSRLLCLDYDGTLVSFANRPREAAPSAALHDLLVRLSSLPSTKVALVSGRPRADLEEWFGDVDALWLMAEHGAIFRSPQTRQWKPLRQVPPTDWKGRVQPVLDHYVDRTPGSFVEEKEYCLVWHYRMSDPEFGEWLANELAATLEEMLAETELRAVRGHKSVEVRLTWANKGEAADRLLSDTTPQPGFVLAVGDDRTDEDVFERLPADAWTVHVGDGPSKARFNLPDPEGVHRLLTSLTV